MAQPSLTTFGHRLTRYVLGALGLWAILVIYAILLFGVLPRTLIGWTLFLLAGPLLALLGEIAAGALYHGLVTLAPVQALGNWIARRTAGRTISPLRIGVVLAGFVALFMLCWGILFVLLGLVRRWPAAGHALAEASRFLGAQFWP